MPRAERIIVRSDHMREVVLQADPTLHDTVAVAMRGYDVSLMGATTPSQTLHEQYPQCTFFMAVVAPLEKESGIAFVLQAASFTLRQYSSVGLVICGDGKERDMLKKIVQEKGISGNVFFEPMPHELASLISAAQVLIVPRQTHASEEALRVAALLGVPAIVSEDALHDDVFEHQQSALVCKRDDLGCAIQSIKTYMNDSVLRIRYAKEAKRRAQVHTVAAHTAGEALYAVLSDAVFAHYAKEDGGVNAAPIIRETPSPITGNQPHV
jgi:glycosyltransferase involved in cell wall biosynthesis